MKKVKILSFTLAAGLIIYSNVYSDTFRFWIEGWPHTLRFESESGDFQYVVVLGKGGSTESMERRYETWVKEKEIPKEKIYRTFRANPLLFWNWYRYISDPDNIYKYEYRRKRSI